MRGAVPPASPDKNGAVLTCAPKSHRPTIPRAHRCPLQPVPSTLVAHLPPTPPPEASQAPGHPAPHGKLHSRLSQAKRTTGDPSPPERHSYKPHGVRRGQACSPEQGSGRSGSGESPDELPPCLGFTSRSWSRARFFSWGGGRGRGAPESQLCPTLREERRDGTPGAGLPLLSTLCRSAWVSRRAPSPPGRLPAQCRVPHHHPSR